MFVHMILLSEKSNVCLVTYCSLHVCTFKLLFVLFTSWTYLLQPRFQESGVEFFINGTEYTFRGTLSVIPGDNLASQYLGEYKALNAALRKCRHCLTVDKEMQSKVYTLACIV